MQKMITCTNIPSFVKAAKRKFSLEEDQIIIDMVCRYGIHCWKQVAKEIGRTPRQCRERWKHYLSPGIDSSPWTEEEDIILTRKYSKIGPKWSVIRESLPGRTDVSIKNRHALLMRREKKSNRKKELMLVTAKKKNESDSKFIDEAQHDFFQVLQDLENTIFSADPFSITYEDFNDILNEPFQFSQTH